MGTSNLIKLESWLSSTLETHIDDIGFRFFLYMKWNPGRVKSVKIFVCYHLQEIFPSYRKYRVLAKASISVILFYQGSKQIFKQDKTRRYIYYNN